MKTIAISIFLMFLPRIASADYSGVCGDGVIFSFEESTGTLTISKTTDNPEQYSGAMTNYGKADWRAWHSYRGQIISVPLKLGRVKY